MAGLPVGAGGHRLVLALIDLSIAPPDHPFAYWYYVINGLTALLILGLALWRSTQEWLGQTFLFTVLLIGLVLTAWQYRWRHVAFFCLGTALLNLGVLILAVGPLTRSFFFELLNTAIQIVSFGVLGYFINALITQLRSRLMIKGVE